MHQQFTDLSQAKARLHLSESPFKLPDYFLEAIAEEARNINLYPEPCSITATHALAKHWNIAADSLVITNGCDEAILNTFLKLGNTGNVLVSANSYPGYRELAHLARQEIKEVPLKGWEQDVTGIIKSADSQTKLAIICNPHNPTGSILSEAQVDDFVTSCNRNAIIPVVDEAYMDFSETGRSLVSRIHQYESLIVWRSFAKSHGLAGIRLGAAVGTPTVVAKLKEAAESNPFSVNRIAQRAIIEITKDERSFVKNREKVVFIRDLVQQQLKDLDVWYNPSHANFLFIKPPRDLDAKTFYKESGVFVRDCIDYGLQGYWRVACGEITQMTCFIDGIKKIVPHTQLSEGLTL